MYISKLIFYVLKRHSDNTWKIKFNYICKNIYFLVSFQYICITEEILKLTYTYMKNNVFSTFLEDVLEILLIKYFIATKYTVQENTY